MSRGAARKGKKTKEIRDPLLYTRIKENCSSTKENYVHHSLESADSRGQDAIARGFSSAQRALALALSWLCAEGILALEFLSARLGKEGLWFGSKLRGTFG